MMINTMTVPKEIVIVESNTFRSEKCVAENKIKHVINLYFIVHENYTI